MLDCFNINIPFGIKGIYTALDFHWESDKTFGGERHDFWEIVTVLAGQVEVVEDDRCYVLDRGMTVCHAPGEFHRIKSAGGTSPHFLVLTFCHEGHLPDRLREGVFSLDEGMMEEYLRIFYPLADFYTRSRAALKLGGEQAAAGIAEYESILRLERYLLSLSRLDVYESGPSMSASAREYRDLVRVMTERVREDLSLSELAALRYISVSYVKKLFRAYAGEGAMSYYARLQVSEIKKLLDSGESIAVTAEIMNFSSGAYLSSFFKRHTGMTPGEYVRRS